MRAAAALLALGLAGLQRSEALVALSRGPPAWKLRGPRGSLTVLRRFAKDDGKPDQGPDLEENFKAPDKPASPQVGEEVDDPTLWPTAYTQDATDGANLPDLPQDGGAGGDMVTPEGAVVAATATNGGSGSEVERTAPAASTLGALYKFTRPHTIRGTILASVAAVIRAVTTSAELEITAALFGRAFLGMSGLLLGNAFIVGINQIYDVKIDRINKPFLPMAAGEMSKRTAWIVVGTSLLGGLGIVQATFSPLIFSLYCVGLGLGAIYSVPPFNLKRFAIAAAGIIAVVRGFLLNFGVYYAVKEALGVPFQWDPIVLFVARFMTVFAAMIAVTKDLPDVAGDIKYNVKTFASTLGVGKVASFATTVLCANYGLAVLQGACQLDVFRPIPMVGGHLLAGIYAAWNRRQLQPNDSGSVKKFYARIWNLFYFEYGLYAFL